MKRAFFSQPLISVCFMNHVSCYYVVIIAISACHSAAYGRRSECAGSA